MNKKVYKDEPAVISAEQINRALEGTERQYVQGNLQKEQIIPYIFSERSEIGITYYPEFTHDEAHYHDEITETNYVISGKVCMLLVESGEEFIIEAGGIFSIPPHVTHILKAYAGTKIIFFKDNSKNDKNVVPYTELGLEEWCNDRNF